MLIKFGLLYSLGFISFLLIVIFISVSLPQIKDTVEKLKIKIKEFIHPDDKFNQEIKSWEHFYFRHLRLAVSFQNVVIPFRPMGGNWKLIFLPKGLKLNFACRIANNIFPCWKYIEDLDTAIKNNIRDANKKSYAVWIYVGPKLNYDGGSPVTLLERIVLEIYNYVQTEEQLLNSNLICAGSLDYQGFPQCVSFTNPVFQPSGCHHFLIIRSGHRL